MPAGAELAATDFDFRTFPSQSARALAVGAAGSCLGICLLAARPTLRCRITPTPGFFQGASRHSRAFRGRYPIAAGEKVMSVEQWNESGRVWEEDHGLLDAEQVSKCERADAG